MTSTGNCLPAPAAPSRSRRAILAAASGFLAVGGGFALGSLLGRILKTSPGFREAAPWLLAAAPLLIFGAILLHELGHLAGGRLSSFRFLLLTAGPLRVERRGEGVRLTWNRNLSLWGGIAASAPFGESAQSEASLRKGMILVLAGGPAASLAGALALPLGLTAGADHPAAALIAVFFGLLSAAIALATLLPTSFGGFLSDGARLLQLIRADEEGRRWVHIAALSSLSLSVRPRNWPRAAVEAATQAGGARQDAATAALLRAAWHLDRKEIAETRQWLQAAIDGSGCLPAAAKPSIHIAAAWFYALYEADPARARLHFEAASRPGFVAPGALAAAEAAVLMTEGQRREAEILVEKAAKMSGGQTPIAAELHAEMISELRQRLSAASSPEN